MHSLLQPTRLARPGAQVSSFELTRLMVLSTSTMIRTLTVKPQSRRELRALHIFLRPLAHVRALGHPEEKLPPRNALVERESAADIEAIPPSDIPEAPATTDLNLRSTHVQTYQDPPEQLPPRNPLVERGSGPEDGDPYQPDEVREPSAATELKLSYSLPGVTGDTLFSYRDAILDAVKNERLELVEGLYIAGAGLAGHGPRTEPDKIPLLVAAMAGSEKTLTKLLDLGANINIRDIEGRSAAFWAAFAGHAKCLQILARSGADVNKPDITRNSPLHVAARNGHPDCVRLLLVHHAHNESRGELKRTPLHEAAEHCRVDSVRLLTSFGAAVNAADSIGETPLHKAARAGHEEIVRRLLVYRATPDKVDRYGETPIHLAARGGHKEVLKLLIFWGMFCQRNRFEGQNTPI